MLTVDHVSGNKYVKTLQYDVKIVSQISTKKMYVLSLVSLITFLSSANTSAF